jgi:hypothetical protein
MRQLDENELEFRARSESLEGEMLMGEHAAGLRQLGLIMAGMMRGEMAAALVAFRMNHKEALREYQILIMAAEASHSRSPSLCHSTVPVWPHCNPNPNWRPKSSCGVLP